MRTHLRSAAALAVLALFGGAARAQSTPSPKPNASRPSQLVNDEKVSPADRETRIQKSLEQMRGQETAMEKIAAQARNEKDIVKLDCVNAKVNQAKGLLRISEAAQADLHENTARGDEDAARNAFTKANIASRKVAQLRQEAEQCIGQLAYYTDDKTRVDVEVPAGLPNSDPTYVALPGPVDSRPAPASGF
jgi:hypothetical protein